MKTNESYVILCKIFNDKKNEIQLSVNVTVQHLGFRNGQIYCKNLPKDGIPIKVTYYGHMTIGSKTNKQYYSFLDYTSLQQIIHNIDTPLKTNEHLREMVRFAYHLSGHESRYLGPNQLEALKAFNPDQDKSLKYCSEHLKSLGLSVDGKFDFDKITVSVANNPNLNQHQAYYRENTIFWGFDAKDRWWQEIDSETIKQLGYLFTFKD